MKHAEQIQACTTVKKEWQADWLLKTITLIGLTTISDDDTSSNVQRLCYKAKYPIREALLKNFNTCDKGLMTTAVYVYPTGVCDAVKALKAPCCTHANWRPGQTHLKTRLEEIRLAVENGVMEIDVVINRTLVLTGQQEGSDFIKTSTVKETVNATFPVAIVMLWAIRDFFWKTGNKAGFTPTGGIRSAKYSLACLSSVKEELGDEWMTPELFPIGASTLVSDIERQIYHHVTGR
ncbi:deoxyribose-phosphate aldolase-like [Callorhinus ursinus]|uniref:deoxyribose-phosphate aldolase n=1 Tax=Callorhinus ursinus TaxID=34884 RepID=A0A3Q7NIC2_CALUR|nr:deoxyribose-phosphate aldolase-like [Callorhinus ursinus]